MTDHSGPVPTQHVTIKDVAERLGVSHSTVSRALNDHRHISDEMKTRVREAAAALGYVVNDSARKLRRAESNLIGLIVPGVMNEMFTTITKSLAARCFKAGYQLVLCVTEDDPAMELRHVEALRQTRAIGIIIIPTPRLLEQTAAFLKHGPVVQISRRHDLLAAPSVTADAGPGIAAAVRHLHQLGHKRIAYVGLTTDRSTGVDRIAGYRQALTECGLSYDPALVRLGPAEMEYGREATASLLQLADLPTAMVFGTTDLTHGAVDAFRRAKIDVPEKMSIIGFGDLAWFKLYGNGISTASISLNEMAEAAISLIFRQIAAHSQGQPVEPQGSIMLEPFLILRGSTAPPATR